MSFSPRNARYIDCCSRVLPLLATDLVDPFLAEMACPLNEREMSLLRKCVRELPSPDNNVGLTRALSTVESMLDSIVFDRLLCWAIFVSNPVNSPYPIWLAYDMAFMIWSIGMRKGEDRMKLEGEAQYILSQYRYRMDISEGTCLRRQLGERIVVSQNMALSAWDQLLLKLRGGYRPDDLAWNPFFEIEQTCDMVQFQQFLCGLRAVVSAEALAKIEHYAQSHFHKGNPDPFLGIQELPTVW